MGYEIITRAPLRQIVTLDKLVLDEYIGHIAPHTLEAVEQGIRLVLHL
jgi:mRNA-degrading endonuclease toxin of MazEF toxin-antitoxin module